VPRQRTPGRAVAGHTRSCYRPERTSRRAWRPAASRSGPAGPTGRTSAGRRRRRRRATATPTRSADASLSRPTSSTADSDRCGGRPHGAGRW